MRVLAAIALFALLGASACSGAEGGPRPGVNGSAGAASAGAPPQTAGGSANVVAGTANGGAPPTADTNAHVITWVPPYHISEAKQQLTANFAGAGMADGLSFLALQFWLTDGPATQLHQATEADVTWFHDWARQHNVEILLCVHNNDGDWNWPEAVRAFKTNRDAFAQHLVSQVMARDLDGVDVDLEGIVDASAEDQQAYGQFVQTLSNALHPMGKLLTVDSFHGQWNAPNWSWWPDLFPFVDGITSMGYETSGMGVDYEQLVDHAALAPQKLMIGVPSYQGSWLGHPVSEQLGWLQQQGQVGTAIWDASLLATEWRTRAVWDQLKAIKSR